MRAFDWGYAAPLSARWLAQVVEDYGVRPGPTQRGALVRYRERYGCTGGPGEGPRLDAEAVARGIVEREAGERVTIAVADPSILSQDGGPSIGERMRRAGARFRPADNTRVGKAGAMWGWDQAPRDKIPSASWGLTVELSASPGDTSRAWQRQRPRRHGLVFRAARGAPIESLRLSLARGAVHGTWDASCVQVKDAKSGFAGHSKDDAGLDPAAGPFEPPPTPDGFVAALTEMRLRHLADRG